jgi:hypothetical protein
VFRSTEPKRDKYLSRLFGLFNEEVVRAWAADSRAPYEDLGRPTLRWPEDQRWHTLDFTLRRRSDGAVFVAEMKCELEFEGYRYLRLDRVDQVERHQGSAAFQKFLSVSEDPTSIGVRVAGRPMEVDGGILVWGAADPETFDEVSQRFHFADILTVENIVRDLHRWQPPEWKARVAGIRSWSNELFDWLGGGTEPVTDDARPSQS